MSEGSKIYTIPGNYTNSGKVLGMFDLRSMIEASIAAALLIFPVLRSGMGLEMKIFISLSLGLMLTFFVGSGIRGDSLTQFAGHVFRHLKNRRKLSMRPVNRERGEESTNDKKENKTRNGKSSKTKSSGKIKKPGKPKAGKTAKTKAK